MTRKEVLELPDEFLRWLETPEGKAALEAAAAFDSAIQRLIENRIIQPKQLHVPALL